MEEYVRRYMPLVLGAVAFAAGLAYLKAPNFGWGGFETVLPFAAAAMIAMAVSAVARSALRHEPANSIGGQTTEAADTWTRQRIAPIVLAAGTLAITLLSALLIVIFWRLALDERPLFDPLRGKLDTILLTIFTSTLPVFATWVGTVLAFYFTNESFRQASQVALASASPAGPPHELATVRMIPYEKIAKLVRDRGTARTTPMADIFPLFNDQTTRVVVFDLVRSPIFVIRKRKLPADWLQDDKLTAAAGTIDDYLKIADNASDAKQFGFIPQSSSIEDARKALKEAKADDLFVTSTGQPTEPALGWLTSDRLS